MERRLDQQLKDQYHHFVKKSKPPDYRDPVNSHGGKQPCNVLPHFNAQQPRVTTSNWRARGESAKTSNGTHQHNWWVILDRFFHCLDKDTESTTSWKTSVGNSVDIIQEETSSAIWRHLPSQSNLVDLTSWEVSLLHHHPQREGRDYIRYHRSGHVDPQPRSTPPTHQSFYTAEDVTAGILWPTGN
jgi:hypothetical protein